MNRNKNLLVWSTYFMSLLMIYFLMSWLPLLLKDAGLNLTMAIQSAVYLNLGGMVGGIIIGKLTDELDPFLVLATAYGIAGFAISTIGFLGHSEQYLMVAVFSGGFFVIGAQTAMNAVVTSLYDAQIRSTSLGSSLAVGRIGSIFGPILGGILLAATWPIESIFISAATPAFLRCYCCCY